MYLSATLDQGLSHSDIVYTIHFDAHPAAAKRADFPTLALPEQHLIRRACLPIGTGAKPNQFFCDCIPVHFGLPVVHVGATSGYGGGNNEHDESFGGAMHASTANVLGEGPPERRSRAGSRQAQLAGGPVERHVRSQDVL